MSWTYSGNPLTSPMDEVRFLVGDTNPTTPRIQNEEIQYALTLVYGGYAAPPAPQIGNYLPAAYCADALAAKYVMLVDKSVGDLRISYSGLLKNFQALSVKLRTRAALAGVPVYAGGQSIGEKWALNSDPDRVQPAVQIDGMDAPDTAPPGTQGGSSQTTTP